MEIKLFNQDCIELLKTLSTNSIDSIVTDPPYELGFMGKSWDNTGIANNPLMWAECLRVLKPGGHLLAFSGTRTYHRMAVAIEDAGFEVRDMIEWVYGSGFPKSLNIGKAVDKLQGNEREVVGDMPYTSPDFSDEQFVEQGSIMQTHHKVPRVIVQNTKGTSEYEGWGTALKPAHEPICMARKPLAEKTVAENCLEWGTGGINIDESRVEATSDVSGWSKTGSKAGENTCMSGANYEREAKPDASKRFPANLIHDNSEEVRECFPETKSTPSPGHFRKGNVVGDNRTSKGAGQFGDGNWIEGSSHNDSVNASRFFKSIIYTAKASKSERNKGCEGLEEVRKCNSYTESREGMYKDRNTLLRNIHPTVKPIALMEYLIKMVTPTGGIVLDPFMGSGSTGVACVKQRYSFVGIELEAEYFKIAETRINNQLE